MKYKDIRPQIRSGDLLAWSHRGFKTWYDIKLQLIRLFTRSEYVHVGIAWVVQDRVFVIEAVNPYVRIVPLSNLLPCYMISMHTPWKGSTENLALKYVGLGKYSQLEAIKSTFGGNTTEELLQCVEFVRMIYKADGLEFDIKDIPSDLIFEAQKVSGIRYLEI